MATHLGVLFLHQRLCSSKLTFKLSERSSLEGWSDLKNATRQPWHFEERIWRKGWMSKIALHHFSSAGFRTAVILPREDWVVHSVDDVWYPIETTGTDSEPPRSTGEGDNDKATSSSSLLIPTAGTLVQTHTWSFWQLGVSSGLGHCLFILNHTCSP